MMAERNVDQNVEHGGKQPLTEVDQADAGFKMESGNSGHHTKPIEILEVRLPSQGDFVRER